jgi:hypothetical protein
MLEQFKPVLVTERSRHRRKARVQSPLWCFGYHAFRTLLSFN